jgi:hypothetical protein
MDTKVVSLNAYRARRSPLGRKVEERRKARAAASRAHRDAKVVPATELAFRRLGREVNHG